MRKMNDTEFRIVMLVVRATLGWESDKDTGMRKTEDWISSRQLKEKTGRQSGALSKAIDKCIKEGWIEARSKKGEILDTKGKRKGKNIYFRLGNSILFTTSSESEEVIVKESSTSSESANAESANAESEDYKRNPIQNKDITKDIAELNSAPPIFLLKDELIKLKDSPQRHIQLIGEYLEEKSILIENQAQLKVAVKRHLRAAVDLAKFSDKQIGEATKIAEKEYPDYTLETLVKIATR